MVSLKSKYKPQAVILLLAVSIVAYASITGPDARYTNAPGDLGNCTACHDDSTADTGSGNVRINGAPAVYEPGRQYTLNVTVTHGGRSRFGFQLTAIDNDGNRAGTLAPLSNDTQLNPVTGQGGRQYIQHTELGTSAPVAGSRNWQIQWTAPSMDVGTVRFYVAGNAANGSRTIEGDFIYTNNALSESPTSNVTVSLATPLGGQTLQPGSQITLNWNLTGASNVNSVELRYSTDDGATFPITNLIFTTSDAATTSCQWTVPNVSADRARIRVQVATLAGAAVEARSGRFAIGNSDDPAPEALSITSAEVSGKKLFVRGTGFGEKAKVEINGVPQKTSNDDDDPTHELICKKAGKKISRGSTVQIVVVNPDGTQSAPFPYTRPDQ